MSERETLKEQIERQRRERQEVADARDKKIEEEGFFAWWKEGAKEQVGNFFERESEKQDVKIQERKEKKLAEKEENQQIKEDAKRRYKEVKANNIAHCPKCKSTSVEYIERKKMSLTRGVAGDLLAGRTGALIGATSKKPKGRMKCLNCGKEWKSK